MGTGTATKPRTFDPDLMGAAMRQVREARGLTQAEVSKSTTVSQPKLSEYERGIMIPTLPILFTLAGYYEVSIDTLVGRAPDG